MNPKDFIHESWQPIMGLLYQEPLLTLNEEILTECKYYPEAPDIFRVFSMPVDKIKVVIIGQDPYHGPGQANGLAFAVNDTTPIPPSLRIIRQETMNSIGQFNVQYESPQRRTLEYWKDQGVFLLNTALTVEAGKPGSHMEYWKYFTQRVVEFIAIQNPCVWMLWGTMAQRLQPYISKRFIVRGYTRELIESIPASPYNNYLLSAPHPAAEAYNSQGAGFYGCDHFYFANKILYKTGKGTINW